MIASAWAICATRRLCSWMFSGYVLCMRPQRRMNFIRERYAKKWLVDISDPELGVQGVAQPVAEQIDAERRECEGRAGERGEPPGDIEEVAALGEHAAPRRRRRLHAESEKADRRLGDDRSEERRVGKGGRSGRWTD